MKRSILIAAGLILFAGITAAQTWEPVWKMTTSPYLTIDAIDNMAMVKAGFDTDGDGWGEFLCAWTDEDTNAILLYEASGDNTYDLKWSFVYPVAANSFAGIAVGDVNSNGKVDIVTTMPSVVGTDVNPKRMWVFEWSGVSGENAYGEFNATTQTYDPSASWNFDVPDNYDFRPYSLVIDDIDKDGQNELIVGARQAGSPTKREIVVASFSGEFGGFGSWVREYYYSDTFGGSLYNVTVGDLDNDGNKELHAFIWNLFTLKVIECTGNQQYTEAAFIDALYSTEGVDYGALDGVVTLDVNNDGSKEMFIATTEDPNKLFVISGITDVSLLTGADVHEFWTIPVAVDGGFRSMQAADQDGDGNIELVIAGEREGRIYSLEYKGSGSPADSANWEVSTLFNIFAQTDSALTPRLFYGHPAGDMDKDGKSEYVFINYSPDYASWPDDTPLWIIEMSSVTDVKDETAAIPEGFELLQNYPNPFNPTTSIPYTIPLHSRVQIQVYTIQGKLVALLVDDTKEPGAYTASWAPELPSGTYVYQLVAEPLNGSGKRFVESRKMILLR